MNMMPDSSIQLACNYLPPSYARLRKEKNLLISLQYLWSARNTVPNSRAAHKNGREVAHQQRQRGEFGQWRTSHREEETVRELMLLHFSELGIDSA